MKNLPQPHPPDGNAIRVEANFFGATNSPLERKLLDQAERADAAPRPSVQRLMAAEQALRLAAIWLSRASEGALESAASELLEAVTERRRRL